MFNGKMKALTFSYDDGVTQDKRLIEMFNKYDLKCTFNLNSELLGKPGALNMAGNPAERYMIGDNLRDDIHGSKACGFKTIFIDLRGNRADEKCDHTVREVAEILDILK